MYEWVKVLHVLAIIAWMAGLLYLPRLFVYHAAVPAGSDQSQLFKIMERRLLKAIMTPAMIVAWGAGLWLMWQAGFWRAGWFHGKALLVLVLSGVHMLLARQVRQFAEDANTHPQRYYRILNEVPTLLMIGIVILVVVKPF
jgi:protoporphyrinogen IX oxidase